MVVVDANVAVATIVALPWSLASRAILDREDDLVAPLIYVPEVANALWKNVRSGSLTLETAVTALADAIDLVELVPDADIAAAALDIAIQQDHPVYDCMYVALAQRLGATLVTADSRLAALAERMGIAVELLAA
jgi:predicted nucleic acid-binding protein